MHTTLPTLDELAALLAKPAHEIFPDKSEDAIDAREIELLTACHPDLHDGAARATELFKLVQQRAAEVRKPPVVLKGTKRSYQLSRLIRAGDIADVYSAHTWGDGVYIAKISRVPSADKLLAHEFETLSALHKAAGDFTYRQYFPLPIETIALHAKSPHAKFPRRANIFGGQGGLFPLDHILARHQQLSGRHIGWMFKRLLTGLGFAHKQGIVHGAILPRHLLYQVADHGLVICGWGQSVKIGEKIKHIVGSQRDCYPPEVLKLETATPATDVYMAAQAMLRAFARSDADNDLYHFLRACTLPGKFMRPDDCWALLDDFDTLLKRLYGPPKFVRLDM